MGELKGLQSKSLTGPLRHACAALLLCNGGSAVAFVPGDVGVCPAKADIVYPEFDHQGMEMVFTDTAGAVVSLNMRLLFLPPYSPELNPAEHLWEALREGCFGNHVFADLDAVERGLIDGLRALEADPSRA